MLTWTAKDPDATLDYRWNPPLDPGDTLASATLTKISGDVAETDQQQDETGVTIILTGGTAGLNLFRGTWTSVGGRSDDEYIQIEVRDDLPVPDPLLAAFRARYPAFSGVADTAVSYWLNDADRFVTDGWAGDADPARLAYAAHQLIVSGAQGVPAGAGIPIGVRKFRSASMDVEMTDAAANRGLSSGWDASPYGQEFAVMLGRNTGGPFLCGYVEPRCDVWGGL